VLDHERKRGLIIWGVWRATLDEAEGPLERAMELAPRSPVVFEEIADFYVSSTASSAVKRANAPVLGWIRRGLAGDIVCIALLRARRTHDAANAR
jgi:hypothetical protein